MLVALKVRDNGVIIKTKKAIIQWGGSREVSSTAQSSSF